MPTHQVGIINVWIGAMLLYNKYLTARLKNAMQGL
jgi:hypothetical protein